MIKFQKAIGKGKLSFSDFANQYWTGIYISFSKQSTKFRIIVKHAFRKKPHVQNRSPVALGAVNYRIMFT